RDPHELGPLDAIELPDGPPAPRLEREERGVDERERLAARARRATGEDRQQREDAHLQEDQQLRSAVLPAVELDVHRAVEPGEPEHPEYDRELGEADERDMAGELARRLRDDGHVHEVVEELEVADRAVLDDRAMWPRRAREPALELALRPGRHR